jgi:hypothetical protein
MEERGEGAGKAYLTAMDLQGVLGVSENVVYHELQHGCLRPIAFRVGRQWRVSAAALERLMAGDS